MGRWLRHFNALFAFWVLLFSLIAWFAPGGFLWFRPYIVPGLGCIMLGMGLTLLPEDFVRVARCWRAVTVGVTAQFVLMPLGAFLIASALALPVELRLGTILVAACPGGTASNVIAYLARADVALSISMTATSTLLSPLATPLLLQIYAGESVHVPFLTQATTIAEVVVVPVLAGLAIRTLTDRSGRTGLIEHVLAVFPSISVICIVLIVACIVALNADRMAELSGAVAIAVVLTNAAGLVTGYALTRLLRFDRTTARTVAIEVGMQNSGLGLTLASQFFSAAAALPSAVFSLWHNLSGSALASYWSAHAPSLAAEKGLGPLVSKVGETGSPEPPAR